MRKIRKIILHNSDCNSEKPGTFHYSVSFGGEIMRGLGLNQTCLHCNGQENDSITILIRGNKKLNILQRAALRSLNLELFDLFGLGNDQVFDHMSFAPESCCTIVNLHESFPL